MKFGVLHKLQLLHLLKLERLNMFYKKFVALCAENNKYPTQVAAEIGVSTGNITHWKNGKTPHTLTVKKIADYFGVDPSYFSEEKEQKETPPGEITFRAARVIGPANEKTVMLPVYGKVSAGNGHFADDEIVAYEPALSRYAGGLFFYLEAEGDSMEPKIHDGDLLLVQKTSSVDNGNVAVVLVDNEDGVVKKVIYDLEHIALISFNKAYPTREFWHEDVKRLRVLGRVLEAKTKF